MIQNPINRLFQTQLWSTSSPAGARSFSSRTLFFPWDANPKCVHSSSAGPVSSQWRVRQALARQQQPMGPSHASVERRSPTSSCFCLVCFVWSDYCSIPTTENVTALLLPSTKTTTWTGFFGYRSGRGYKLILPLTPSSLSSSLSLSHPLSLSLSISRMTKCGFDWECVWERDRKYVGIWAR